MNIIVLQKQVPDLVEELEIDESGKALKQEWLKFIPSEYDDHALEQALLLKEKHGGILKVYALSAGESDEMLFTAIAKGADTCTKITSGSTEGLTSHQAAGLFHQVISQQPFDLILTGVQAIDDLDGSVGGLLACTLNLPYVGVVRGVTIDEAQHVAVIGKELPGGMIAEYRVQLPAVFGIQAAVQPPRYVPIARIRQAMKSATIQEISAGADSEQRPLFAIQRLSKPEITGGATMLEGSMEEVSSKLISLLAEKGIGR